MLARCASGHIHPHLDSPRRQALPSPAHSHTQEQNGLHRIYTRSAQLNHKKTVGEVIFIVHA